MKAICWHGRHDVRCDTVPDPKIEDPRDIIIKIKATAICGSDLHLYDGFIPGMREGDILGHEPLGEVVELGAAVETLAVGDRVVVPFTISCGDCFFCDRTMYSLCDNSNPNSARAREVARMEGQAETVNFSEQDVYRRLMDMTNGRGPDRCIDAVGAEAHASNTVSTLIDRAKDVVHLAMDRPHALAEMIRCCRKGGTVSVAGAYVGSMVLPFGAVMNKALTIKSGQTHVQRYLEPLLRRIEEGEIDPSFVITHRVSLRDVPAAYEMFRDKKDGCVKVVVTP